MIVFKAVIFIYCWAFILLGLIVFPMFIASWLGAMAYMTFPSILSFVYGSSVLFIFIISCAIVEPLYRAYRSSSKEVFA